MTSALSNFSDELTATVIQVGAGVVQVDGRRRLPASGIVWSADGVIVTAHHVVEQEDSIRVGLPDGPTVPATLVGREPSIDLAVLRAEAKDLTPGRRGLSPKVCALDTWCRLWAGPARASMPPLASSVRWETAGSLPRAVAWPATSSRTWLCTQSFPAVRWWTQAAKSWGSILRHS